MKKPVLIATMLMLAIACDSRRPAEAQTGQFEEPIVLKAGNLLGFHTVNYKLTSGVMLDEWLNFMRDEYATVGKKYFPGMKTFVLRGRTGECVGCVGYLYFFESTDLRDKYINDDGSLTELGTAEWEKLQPVFEEERKLVEYTTTYTDWEIIGDTGTPGPELQPGNLLGFHTIHSELAPGVAEDEWLDFMKDEYAPAWEENFPGLKGFVLRGRTGECVGCVGFLVFFESAEVRDRYWNADGSYTEVGQVSLEKMQPVFERGSRYGEYTSTYTDWLIR